MTPRNILSVAAALTMTMSAVASAQTSIFALGATSKVTVAGGSNVHDWSCSGNKFDAGIELATGSFTDPLSDVAKPIGKVVVSIPTKSVKCGKDKMDENMYKALKAEQFPTIKYELTSYTLDPSKTTATSFVALTKGELTVAEGVVHVSGKDPGFLWRKRAVEYLKRKLATYLDPARPLQDLPAS